MFLKVIESMFMKLKLFLSVILLFNQFAFAGGIKIAVDIGGPTINLKDNKSIMKGAKESLQILSRSYDVYFLSYCGERMEAETRKKLIENEIQLIIPEEKWIFVRTRPAKAEAMVENKIRLLIDDDRHGVIKEAVLKESFQEGGETIPLEFIPFDIEAAHPWQDVFSELQIRKFLTDLPEFSDGIPQLK
jgi:hypothetical protein